MSGGKWVFVCGPSGAGKDSVLASAAARLAADPRIVFTRRLVTRAAGPAPEHEEVSRAALLRLRGSGGLAWEWEANGHAYAVPARYRDDVAAGRVVVVNGSREHVAGVASREPVHAVLVIASPATLRARLGARGREDAAAIARRLERNALLPALPAGLVLPNEESLEAAGARLARHLQELAAA